MSNPEDRERTRMKRQRNLVAKHNKYKPKALSNKKVYKRHKFDPQSPSQEG